MLKLFRSAYGLARQSSRTSDLLWFPMGGVLTGPVIFAFGGRGNSAIENQPKHQDARVANIRKRSGRGPEPPDCVGRILLQLSDRCPVLW